MSGPSETKRDWPGGEQMQDRDTCGSSTNPFPQDSLVTCKQAAAETAYSRMPKPAPG